ncbi:glycosyltransferase family 4 protein [Paenibacillus filicis]|uniref:Glycosyltransferase family 4 protein n=1 Tax=Paenibacillus filicis TaxID=669464 RepID=A0ABU9DDG7_9BACL
MRNILLHGALSFPPTGVGVANEIIIEELEKRNVNVIKIRRGSGNSKFLTWDGKVSINRVAQTFNEIFKIAWTLWKVDIDCMYMSAGQSTVGIIADMIKISFCVLNKVPIVIHVHGGRLAESINNLPKYLKNRYISLLNKSRCVIALTDDQRRSITNVGLTNVITIYNAVKENEVCNIEMVEGKLKRSSKKLNVVYLSNLIEEKGYKDLVNSALELNKSYGEHFVFRFAGQWGSVHDKVWFSEKTKDLRNCTYEGVVRGENKKDLLEWADVWVLPTYFVEEGLPISLLEAMWSGCAVITTNYRGIPEVVTDQGAIFVSANCPSEVTAALLKLLTDKATMKNMIRVNTTKARESFKESFFSNRVIETFNLGDGK